MGCLLVFYVMLVVTMFVEVSGAKFSYSSIWGEEIVRYSFIYLAWIGAAAAVASADISASTSSCIMSARAVKALLYMFGDLVMLSWPSSRSTGLLKPSRCPGNSDRSPTACASRMVWFLLAVPLVLRFVIFRLIQSFLRDINSLRTASPCTKATSCSTEGISHVVAAIKHG
jgi:C4-dicarboxylate transporter DctQ subunit